jgi:hypothetical protein
MTSRKHPSAAFWVTVVVVVALVAYPLSFGPACWWFAVPDPRVEIPVFNYSISPLPVSYSHPNVLPKIFWPIGWAADNAAQPIREAVRWYVTLRHDCVALPIDAEGSAHSVYRVSGWKNSKAPAAM